MPRPEQTPCGALESRHVGPSTECWLGQRPHLPAAAAATLEPPPSFPSAPTAPGRLRPDLPQIIPGVRRPGWWFLPSYASAPRGRTTFNSLGKRSRGGALWAAHTDPRSHVAAAFCSSSSPGLPFCPLAPSHPTPFPAPQTHTLVTHGGPEQRRQVRWSLISLPLQPCGWVRRAMGQGPTASQGQGELQAGWRIPWTCEPFSGSGNPCLLLSIPVSLVWSLGAPGVGKLALKKVKETLRHLSASNRPLQNSL